MNGLLASVWLPSGMDLRLLAPEFALVATLVALLTVPLITGRSHQLAAVISLLGVALMLLVTGVLVAGPVAEGGLGVMSPTGQTPMLVIDKFAVFFKLLLAVFLVLVIWLWLTGYWWDGGRITRERLVRPGGPEFFVLLITSALGMALMVSTLNLLAIIIAIETASLPSYAMVGSDKRSRRGAEASLKYVLFGAATAAIMVYGASLLYGLYGTLDIPTMASAIAKSGGLSALGFFALFAFGVGVAFKISAVPFHYWCPDVFEGAPIEVTTWLSVVSKGAGIGLLMRLVAALGVAPDLARLMLPAAMAIGLIACITCTVGNLAALRQTSVRRMLAYSSIAHAGYVMMAAAIFMQPADASYNIGLSAVVFYLFVYLLMNLGAFGVTAMIEWRTGTDHIDAFTALGRRSPGLAIPMTLCLFSLIGLPPFGGFVAKWWLLLALGRGASLQPWLWVLVVVAVINTVLSLFYYVRVIAYMFLAQSDEKPASQMRIDAPLGGLVMVNACALALLLLGTVLIDPLGEKSAQFASDLYAGRAATTTQAASVMPEPLATHLSQR